MGRISSSRSSPTSRFPSKKRTDPDGSSLFKIEDADGKTLCRAKPSTVQALGSAAAEDALDVLGKRSGTRCFTGATGSERDAWTLRLGPSGSTAIWIGFDNPKRISGEARLTALLDEFVERLGN